MGQVDVLVERDRERDLTARAQAGDDLVWRGCHEGGRRRCVVDDEWKLCVGIVGIRLVAALIDDPHPSHVVPAVVAGHGREQAVEPDVVSPVQAGQGRGVGDEPGVGRVDAHGDLEGSAGRRERRARIRADVLHRGSAGSCDALK